MRIMLIFVVSFWITQLPGQEAYFVRLASEVCNCMERISVEPINKQAINCLREVALANEESLRRRYSLVAREASQRDLLAERLAGDLVRDCPLLSTINYEKEEELRWSDKDRPVITEPQQFRSTKGPPADPADSITGEPPLEWRAEGILQRLAARNILLLLTNGETMMLELPAGVARSNRLKEGDQLRLSFRREWRKGENQVINVVIDVQE
ncbi:MAG: hypothetical protein AB8H12_04750 [Lewinella sp.]